MLVMGWIHAREFTMHNMKTISALCVSKCYIHPTRRVIDWLRDLFCIFPISRMPWQQIGGKANQASNEGL